MESIQLAQMLADLSDLSAAQEAQAALALVNANKAKAAAAQASATESQNPATSNSKPSYRRVQSSGNASRNSSPAHVSDMLGRRFFTPPMSRNNSAQGSAPDTPKSHEAEDDIDRATSLMALYDIRAKLKQQDSTSLTKAREKIAALQARQHAEKRDGNEKHHYTYPKSN